MKQFKCPWCEKAWGSDQSRKAHQKSCSKRPVRRAASNLKVFAGRLRNAGFAKAMPGKTGELVALNAASATSDSADAADAAVNVAKMLAARVEAETSRLALSKLQADRETFDNLEQRKKEAVAREVGLAAGAGGHESAESLPITLLLAALKDNQEILIKLAGAHRDKPVEVVPVQASGFGILEVIEGFAKLQAILNPSRSADSTDHAMEMFERGLEIGARGTIEPAERKGTGWMAVVDKGIGVVGDVVAALPGALRVLRPQAGATAPAPVTMPAPSGAVAGQQDALGLTPEEHAQLMTGLGQLKVRCELGKHPDLMADLIVDNLECADNKVIVLLASKSLDEIAALTDPTIIQPTYRAWFDRLFLRIKEGIKARDSAFSEEDQPEGAGS